MTLPLTPGDRFKLSLASDKDVEEETRRWFWFRFLSGRQQREVAVLFGEFEAIENSAERIDKVFEILRLMLVGWENVTRVVGNAREREAVPYDPANAEDVLQYLEADQLVYKVWGYSPTGEDLGFADSQSSTDTAESAAPEADVESA